MCTICRAGTAYPSEDRSSLPIFVDRCLFFCPFSMSVAAAHFALIKHVCISEFNAYLLLTYMYLLLI
jgi:hypothetical protein